jgi:thioredoxin:protein disulfide reductase
MQRLISHLMISIGKSLLFFLIISFSMLAQSKTKVDVLSNNSEERPLLATGKINPYKLEPLQSALVEIEMSLPEGYRAYEEQFALTVISPEGFKISKIQIDLLKEFYDENTKKTKRGMIGNAKSKTKMTATIEAPADLKGGEQQLILNLKYQACTKTYCLFPLDHKLEIPFASLSKHSQETENSNSFWNLSFSDIQSRGLLITFLFVFFAGILTSFTPCIFPMIPITLSILGQNAHLRSRKHNFLLAHVYVLGIATTYSALGVFAAATGAMFGSFMSHPLVLSFICLVFLTMSLSMFGVFELQAPQFLQKRLGGDLHVKGYHGIFIYGIIAGLVASPCVGPVLVGVLTYIAKSQNLWLGFWLMFTFAFGMGQLFILIGVFSHFTKLLPKSGPWMNGVKNFFGILMIGAALYYLQLLVTQRWWDLAAGLIVVATASGLGAFHSIKIENHKNLVPQYIWKGLCQALVIVGGFLIAFGVFDLRQTQFMSVKTEQKSVSIFANYSDQALQKALADKKPVMIDFWAEWCAACLELEQKTFTQNIFKEVAQNFVLLKFDATNDSPELDILKKKYGIVGLPTIIFYDSKGQLRTDLTVNEFIEAPKFVERMKKALD